MGLVRGPTDGDRVIVLGRTGSGKSQFAVALLSTRDWDVRPWFIIDYKGEDLIEEILVACEGYIQHVKVTDKPPSKPGLYYVKCRPLEDDIAIEVFLKAIYDRASNGRKRFGSGIFLDEGYALPRNSKYFDILVTQGRTLHCPIICLYQRPVHMSRFVMSQSTFRTVFELDDSRDAETASRFIRPAKTEKGDISVFDTLPKYHSLWYDVAGGTSHVLGPAPDRRAIISAFQRRLIPAKHRVQML